MQVSRSKFAAIVACVLTTSLAARAQMVAHYEVNQGGGIMAGLGDLNGDGHADVVVALMNGLSVAALSGVDRTQLWEIPLPQQVLQPGNPYGYYSMANAGDVDGDGRDDLVIGCTTCDPAGINVGSVHVYSGATQVELYEWFGAHPGANFGGAVSTAGDVDGDGRADIAASSGPSNAWPPPPPYVDVYSGVSGALLYRFTTPSANSGFGFLGPVGDVDSDGFDDILTGGAPSHQPGHAYLYSGASGALLYDFAGAPGSNLFGVAGCGLGDVDADGFDDIAISAPEELLAAGPFGALGRVYEFSGRTGALLWSTEGIWNQFRFGWPLTRLSDLDGDGIDDMLLGAYWQNSMHGRLAILSGRTGAITADFDPLLTAYDIAKLGDVNADGFDDFGATGLPEGHGAVAYGVYLGNAPTPTVYCTAKTNSAGCVPKIASRGSGPSMSVGDDVSIGAYDVVTGVAGALVWSLSSASTPFAGGTLCIGTSSVVAVRSSGYWYGYPGYGCFGNYEFALRRSYLHNQGLSAGTTLYAQIVSRDPGFAWPNNIGLTDALAIVIAP